MIGTRMRAVGITLFSSGAFILGVLLGLWAGSYQDDADWSVTSETRSIGAHSIHADDQTTSADTDSSSHRTANAGMMSESVRSLDLADGLVLVDGGTSAVVPFQMAPSRPVHIGARDFEALSRIPGLRRIWLDGVTIDPHGLRFLARMNGLKELGLNAYNLHDTDLAVLEALKGLEALSIGRSQVTDDGLVYVRTCSTITWLELGRSQVTPEAVEQLRKDRPALLYIGHE